MTTDKGSTSLLDTLRDLYRQVVERILQTRQANYRPQAKARGSGELARQLRDFIKKVPAPAVKSSAPSSQGEPENRTAFASHPTSEIDKDEPPIDLGPGLAETHYDHATEESLGEKLMQSAWEHLHASIRCARLGNRDTAQLHAGIMESSLKEAAQFLDRERYRKFVADVEKELAEQTRLLREKK